MENLINEFQGLNNLAAQKILDQMKWALEQESFDSDLYLKLAKRFLDLL